MDRIVVGIDGSEASQKALDWAIEEARLRNAAVEVVHGWQPLYAGGYPFAVSPADATALEQGGEALVERQVAEADTEGLVTTVTTTIVCGSPAAVLVERAEGAAMVVVGARGHGGFSRLLLGSVSSQLVHHATCPVVVVR